VLRCAWWGGVAPVLGSAVREPQPAATAARVTTATTAPSRRN
jgi:hypothetical protein